MGAIFHNRCFYFGYLCTAYTQVEIQKNQLVVLLNLQVEGLTTSLSSGSRFKSVGFIG